MGQIGAIQLPPRRAGWCWGRGWRWFGCRGQWCSVNDHAHGQACIVIPVAALQCQHQVTGQVCMHASRPRIAAAVGASTVQVSALQAQPQVVVVTIPVHQPVGQAFGILGRCTTGPGIRTCASTGPNTIRPDVAGAGSRLSGAPPAMQCLPVCRPGLRAALRYGL